MWQEFGNMVEYAHTREVDMIRARIAIVMCFFAAIALAVCVPSCSEDKPEGGGENCADRMDNDGDGKVDCVDEDCADNEVCQNNPEFCSDGLDNDGDGMVDCVDTDCAGNAACSEDCGNGVDDNGDGKVDCDDPECNGIDPRCGEICGDGVDNDNDGQIDCKDEDCFDVVPPCGGGVTPDGTICSYGGEEPHVCECGDGEDNDGDGRIDADDLHGFGPFDDDESSYATGIPGDNKGSKADTECPFDGNSGPGNDGVCCNPADPTQNVTPNGCDNLGCCEIDVNGNSTGEKVYVREDCVFAPECGQEGQHGCACTTAADCDAGQFCVMDNDQGPGFCSLCEACTYNEACANTCECGELCYGGFEQPAEECGGDPQPDGGGEDGGGQDAGDPGNCPAGVTECSADTDCDMNANERCTNGCCFQRCSDGVTPCATSQDCPTDTAYYCITGCCIEVPN
jgi:hypothetical protein